MLRLFANARYDFISVRRYAYIVTVSEHGAPHAVYVPVRRDGDGLVVEVGAQTAANAAAATRQLLITPPVGKQN